MKFALKEIHEASNKRRCVSLLGGEFIENPPRRQALFPELAIRQSVETELACCVVWRFMGRGRVSINSGCTDLPQPRPADPVKMLAQRLPEAGEQRRVERTPGP